MKATETGKAYTALFLISIYTYLVYSTHVFAFGYVSNSILLLDAAMVTVVLLYCWLFVAYFGRFRRHALISLPVATLAILVLSVCLINWQSMLAFLGVYSAWFFLYFVMIFPPFCILSLGIYVHKHRLVGRFSGWAAVVMALAALLFVVIFTFFAGSSGSGSSMISDEQFVPLQAARTLLLGGNPYLANFANQVMFYSLKAALGATLTTSNGVVGTINYPALNFLLYVPFYLASRGLTYSMVFLVADMALLLTLAFLQGKGIKRPNYIVGIFIAVIIAAQPSGINILLAAVAMAAYMKLESKYVFILLGIAASMQQIIWVPVLLLITYKANNEGLRSGAKALLGTLLVFLLINGYFIAIGPLAYMKGIFTPLENVLPSPFAPYGYALLAFYPIPLNAFFAVYAGVIAISLLIMLRVNRKEMVWLLALPSLYLMYRGIPAYTGLFIPLFMISIFLNKDKGEQVAKRPFCGTATGKLVIASAIAVVSISMFAYVYVAHGLYTEENNIWISNATLRYVNNSTVFSGTLNFNMHNSTERYLVGFFTVRYNKSDRYLSMGKAIMYGYVNNSRIAGLNLTAYSNMTNYLSVIQPNTITLSGKGTQNISISVFGIRANSFRCNLYDGGSYYYLCPPIVNGTLSAFVSGNEQFGRAP